MHRRRHPDMKAHQHGLVAPKSVKTRRGRRSKARQDEILSEYSAELVKHLKLYPLRLPIDDRFKAYYERFLAGDASPILQYYDETPREDDIADSFYELLGKLVTIRFYKSADLILSRIENSYPTRWPQRT
jgi:hypothetical protein